MVFSHDNSGWLLCPLFCRSDRIWTPHVFWFVLTSCLLITILQMAHYWRALAIFLLSNRSLPLTSHGRKQLSPQSPLIDVGSSTSRRWGIRLIVMHSCLQLWKLFQNLDRRGPASPNTVTWGQKVSDSTAHFEWQLMFLACLITCSALLKAVCVCEGVHQHDGVVLAQCEVGQINYARWTNTPNLDKCFFCPLPPTVDQTTSGKHFLCFKHKIEHFCLWQIFDLFLIYFSFGGGSHSSL